MSMPQYTNRFWIAMTLCGTILIATIIALSVHSSASDDTRVLKLLHVVVRHGSRTPVSTYPRDPYVNETFFPYGWGQLTNHGKLQLHDIGKFLRQRYDKFLGKIYDPDEYYAQSTDVDRTITSVQVLNAALWPPEPPQQWGPINWQPIPVHIEPLSMDSLLLVRRPCPQYHMELERVVNLQEIQRRIQENRPLFQELAAITGQEVNNFDSVQDIFNTLKAEEAYNLTLPAWIKDYYPQRMLEPTIFSYTLNAYTTKLKRLKGGLLLKKLVTDWKDMAAGKLTPPNAKAFLYGGHDSTIANILSALNVWEPQFPDYGITVLFELFRDKITNNYGVQVYLRNSTQKPPFLLTIPGCEPFCPLDKLINLTQNVIPGDWDAECATSENYEMPPLFGP